METKVCRSCVEEKELVKRRLVCRDCFMLEKRNYYNKNKIKISIKQRNFRSNNVDKIKEQKRIYYKNNRDEIIQKNTKYKKENRSVYNKNRALKALEDPEFRLRETVRSMIKKAMKGNKNGSSIYDYLAYSMQELRNYIESLFKPWMTWDNNKKYNPKTWDDNDQSTWVWNLDHIAPQSDFPYKSMEEDNFKKCWALDNLRPYSAKQNIIDGSNRLRHKKDKK